MNFQVLMLFVVGTLTMSTPVLDAGQADQLDKDGQVTTNAHPRFLQGVDRSVTNRVQQWVTQLKAPEQKKRVEGVSNLFICSLLGRQMVNDKKIGDDLVLAYKKESAGEIRLAILATLDVLEHPDLPGLLVEATKDKDPAIRNMVTIIKEKRYLEPVVIEDP